MREKLIELVQSNKNFTRAIKSPKYPELLAWTNEQSGDTLMEKIYNVVNNVETPECPHCGKPVPLISLTLGYRQFCDAGCQVAFNRKNNYEAAIKKLEDFGSIEYISGYENSHSKVTVKNKNCGCTFEATYLNLFTNPNYCSKHGRELKIQKLTASNYDTEINARRKEKVQLTTEARRRESEQRALLQNQIIENEVLLSGNFAAFFDSIREAHWIHAQRLLKKNFARIHEMVEVSKGECFWEKVFNLCNPGFKNECRECGQPTQFDIYNSRAGYRTFCGNKCAALNLDTQEKMRKTNVGRYGVDHHLSDESVKQKRYATNIEKYGHRNALQNKEIFEKTMKARYKMKDVVLPSGRIVKLMGYEPQVVGHLLENGYSEEELVFAQVPTFRYGNDQIYFPDLYVPGDNLIIEVKSRWTYDIDGEKNAAKAEATRRSGFRHVTIVWDDRNGVIEEVVGDVLRRA